jgi:hypothetical protein
VSVSGLAFCKALRLQQHPTNLPRWSTHQERRKLALAWWHLGVMVMGIIRKHQAFRECSLRLVAGNPSARSKRTETIWDLNTPSDLLPSCPGLQSSRPRCNTCRLQGIQIIQIIQIILDNMDNMDNLLSTSINIYQHLSTTTERWICAEKPSVDSVAPERFQPYLRHSLKCWEHFCTSLISLDHVPPCFIIFPGVSHIFPLFPRCFVSKG